nr:TPA_asm: P3 [Pogostemom alphacytorhabdovirus 1_Pog]
MLNVNDVRKSVIKAGSLTASVGTGCVYSGQYNRYARKRELNIVVSASEAKALMIRQVPLFDKFDLDMLRADSDTNKYLHIGCVTMSIEPLMHNRFMQDYGPKIRGHCLLVDAAFKKLEESIIAAYNYNLKSGRADYVSFPNHCLSLSDPHIQKRLSVIVGFDNIDVDPGTELFNLCIGYIITGVNTLNPTGMKGIQSFPINGATELDVSELINKGDLGFEKSYNKAELITNPSDDDVYLKSKGSFLSNLMGTTKVIKRRTLRVREIPNTDRLLSLRNRNPKIRATDNSDSKNLGHKGKKESGIDIKEPHRRSISGGIDEDSLYKILSEKAVIARVNSLPRGFRRGRG